MNRIIVGLIVIMMLFSQTALAAPAAGSVGVVDVSKVMAESSKIKAFQEQLNQKAKELSDKLEAEKAGLTPEQFKQKQDAAYSEFLQVKKELEQQIDTGIKQVLEQVALEKKLTLILYKNSVAFGGLDVTQDVISKLR